MGTKLETTCADIARVSSALRDDRGVLDEGRKDRKRWKNQDKLYHGLDNPLGAKPPKKAKKPGKSKKKQKVQPAAPRTPAVAQVGKAQTVKIVSDPVSKPSAPKPPAPPAEPKRPSLASKLKLPGFLRGKKPPQDRNQPPAPEKPSADRLSKFKGLLKRVGRRVPGLRRLMDDVYVPRTVLTLYLSEERSSTTFKKCPKGAMVSTAYLRHSMPKNRFVKPDEDNPTLPIRSKCRASMGGVARSLQKDMSNADEATIKQTLQRLNQFGGTRGKARFRAWGTGVGGKRMETFRGPPGSPKRTAKLAKKLGISKKKASKLHGVSTGRPDNQKHTPPYSPPGGSKGPAGNREVPRHPLAHAKPKGKKKSKGSQKRRAAQQAGTIKRGKAKIGR